MLKLAQTFATLKGTKVIEGAYKLREDGTITFVLEAGPKLTMTEAELRQAIEDLEAPTPTVIDTTDGVSQKEASAAGRALAQTKAEAKAKAKAEKAEAKAK